MNSRVIDGQNLNPWINNLIWCRSFVTTGGFGRERINGSAHVYGFERTGGTKALVFLNSNQGAAESIAFPTSIPSGTVLQDYTGHSFNPVTVASGSVTLTVPANLGASRWQSPIPPSRRASTAFT